MGDFEEQSLNGRNARAGRIRWSEQMNSDPLECKRQALILAKSENPPVKDNDNDNDKDNPVQEAQLECARA